MLAPSRFPALTAEELAALDEDVREEALMVEKGTYGESRHPAVVIDHLCKTFGSFKAVNKVSYAIDKDQCFVILGHNGAGKSTTFNMLTGLTHVTDGDARIFGLSVREDMAALHSRMGVCPQHDVLWDQLTGREHLEMFARIKGIPASLLQQEVATRLKQVNLEGAADIPTKGYSGGMKRRLSISIALLGNPSIVFLDEPTTGMDPVSRREVWDMIAAAKKGRVIVLTTHSMEEADVLGDRIGVMSHGKLQAVGSSLRLKSRFGKGYRLTMFVSNPEAERQVTEWITREAPSGTALASSVEGALLYQLPRQENSDILVQFFKKFEAIKASLGVSDYSISLSTLEEVFLTLSDRDNFITSEELITKRRRSNSILKKQQKEDQDAKQNNGISMSAAAMADAAPKKVAREGKVGMKAQFRALGFKSLTYQLKQKASCCAIVSFPLFIMLALVGLDRGLFQTFKLEAICGKGVSKADCLTKGPDLDCIADLSQMTFASTPTISVGLIQNFARGGVGINANCGPNSCYDGLEKADYRAVPYHASSQAMDMGALQYEVPSADLFNFQANLYFALQNTSCSATYNDAFDFAVVCKDRIFDKATCQDEVRALTSAREYLKKNSTGPGQSAVGISVCARDDSGGIQIPTQAVLDKLNAITNAQDSCLSAQRESVYQMFESVDVKGLVAQTWKTGYGVLANYTSTVVPDSMTSSFAQQVFLATAKVAQMTVNPVSLGTWYTVKGYDPMKDLVPLQDLCDQTTLPVVWYTPLNVTLGNNQARLENFCAWAQNLDVIRHVGFEFYNSEKELDTGIYKKWFGQEVQTQFMKDRSSYLTTKLKYLERSYYANFHAFDFAKADQSNGVYSYVAYFNNSATRNQQNGNWRQIAWLMDNAIVNYHTGHSIEYKSMEIPKKFKCNRDAWLRGEEPKLECPSILTGFLALSILDFVAAQLFPYIFLIHTLIIVSLIVYEKETKLLMIMKMMGMNSTAYWVVTYVWFLFQFMVMFLLMYIIGVQAGVNTFALHDGFVVWFFAFSWGNLQVAYSFLLSIFFSSSRASTATVFLAMLIFCTMFAELISTLVQDPYAQESQYATIIWLPPVTMLRVVYWLSLAGAFSEKILASQLMTYAGGAIGKTFIYMWVEWAACLLLVWYLDKVWIAGFGVREHPLFFLSKKYWCGSEPDLDADNLKGIPYEEDVANSDFESKMGDDVKREYSRVVDLNSDALVRIVRLNKRYGNGKLAVKALSLGINRNECFCLLGHNGAGKTTTINMMCGLFEPSAGTATVDGYSIKTDMPSIQARTGVCVQDNLLWDNLSCRDHVLFYGRLKGLTGKELTEAADAALVDVNLKKFEHRRAGALSGGMKRRLSVANALIGNPKVVYLDEPSTGLDPSSRRQLWDVISRAKGNKSIVLTTHSMEEAEILSDRVGIMALGELQCVGSSAELCRRYGAGYTFSVSINERTTEGYTRIAAFVKSLFPSARLLEEPIGGTSKFEVKREDVVLSKVFETMESKELKEKYGIANWGLSETTLEEVFLHLSEQEHVSEKLAKPYVPKASKSWLPCFRRSAPPTAGVAAESTLAVKVQEP